MRNSVLTGALATLLLALSLLAIPPPASAVDIPPPRMYFTIVAHDEGTETFFLPASGGGAPIIIVGQFPVTVNLTLVNDGALDHTFSIRSTAAAAPSEFLIDVALPRSPTRDTTRTVEFLIVAANQIQFGARNETVELDAQRIKFLCRPHEGAGMVGFIATRVAQQETEPAEKGVFLRAYWIGLLGFAGTLLLVGISYFVIKGSSPHFRDHHEHIRRGGP